MIRIGERIKIIDDLENASFGYVKSHSTKVLFDDILIGTVYQLEMTWNAEELCKSRKFCSVACLNSSQSERIKEFAYELVKEGFCVEVEYLKGYRLEYYHNKDGVIIVEEAKCRMKD